MAPKSLSSSGWGVKFLCFLMVVILHSVIVSAFGQGGHCSKGELLILFTSSCIIIWINLNYMARAISIDTSHIWHRRRERKHLLVPISLRKSCTVSMLPNSGQKWKFETMDAVFVLSLNAFHGFRRYVRFR